MERVRLFLAETGVARVFLTGGSGFIGGALIERLHDRGDHVVGLARSDAAARCWPRGVSRWCAAIADEDSMAAGMRGCDLAFHVAGLNSHCPKDPGLMMRVNVGAPRTPSGRRRRPGWARWC